jgi:hypothetical protein
MLTLSVKRSFFDRPAIIAKIGQRVAKGLNRAGGTVKVTAQRSIRPYTKTGKPSKPGLPPRRAVGLAEGLGNIIYAFDGKDAVVIGSVKRNGSRSVKPATTIPGLHERGELATLLEARFVMPSGKATEWRAVPRRVRPGRDGQRMEQRRRSVKYPARPFMQPALEKIKPRLPKLFANSIKESFG